MTYKELQARIDAKDNLLLIDTREPEEFADGLTNKLFVNIPMETLVEQARASKLPTGQTIVLTCRSGNRSCRAAEELTELGYNAHSLDGGATSFKR